MSNRQDDALPELPEPEAFAAGLESNMRGFLDVMAWQEGEFTTPLYTADQTRAYAQSAIASLQARLDAAEADAARYQHIRYFGFNWFGKVIRLAQLDREIDALLAEKTK